MHSTWERWKQRDPDSEVLSRRTGHVRNYRRGPYGSYNPISGYYTDEGILFPLFARSDRFHPKHEIFGLGTTTEAEAVDPAVLVDASQLRFSGKRHDLLILHDPGLDTAWVFRGDRNTLPSEQALSDLQFMAAGAHSPALANLEAVSGFGAMWFAWHAFYPDSKVIDELD